MICGPDDVMLRISKTLSEGPGTIYGRAVDDPATFRQSLTYYEVLRRCDDRAVQHKLGDIPRINWVGTEDRTTLNGEVVVDLQKAFRDAEKELRKWLGCSVHRWQGPP